MCGVVGIVSKERQVSLEELRKASYKLRHRGPDDSGTYVDENKKIGLAHTRLSFIDLSAKGRQPLSSIDGKLTVAFNGEIYNYQQLRQTLINKGYSFSTETDTEVLLHGYTEWGNHLPEYLDGMFAIVIHNSHTQKLLLIRDRFGIKPLYYGVFYDAIVFGSEIKALFEFGAVKKEMRKSSAALFLANRYVPSPFTMWQNIFKVLPASYLEFDCTNLTYKEEKYWRLKIAANDKPWSAIIEKIENEITQSVNKHLVADVPVGTFLSGGMDSSLLLSIMTNTVVSPEAFTIGFSNWQNSEHLFAKEIADEQNATLHSIVLDKLSLADVNKLMYFYDDPIADISIIPTAQVSALAQKSVKAVLSGEGADELFGGYNWHKPVNYFYKNFFSKWKAKIFGHSFRQIKAHYIQAMSMGLYDHTELKEAFHETWQSHIPEDPFQHFDQFKRKETDTLKQLQYLDLNCFMYELVLQKIDKASMANSLEVRVPFLDHKLVEYLFSLKSSSFFDSKIQKKPIRELLKKYYHTNVFNRPKQGFVGPDSYYMDYELYKDCLLNGTLVKNEIIKKKHIENLLLNKDHWRLWKLFVLENWWLKNV